MYVYHTLHRRLDPVFAFTKNSAVISLGGLTSDASLYC